jgi:hypothetical protein
LDIKLTKEEETAIAELKRLAKRWPKSLWLFSASGTLNVMQKVDQERMYTYGTKVNPDYIVTTIKIDNDGGDW